nr:hypothetical protein [Brevibacterium casei]
MHLEPGAVVDEGLVVAGVLCSLPGDDAAVVRVGERRADDLRGDGLGGALRRGPSRQSACGEVFGEGVGCPFARGVQLECFADEVGALGVGFDVAGLGSVGRDAPLVEVAEGCAGDGAAAGGLLVHTLEYLGAQVLGVELVDRGDDAVHESTDRALVDDLGGGDELDARALETFEDDRVVVSVPGEAVELVHDDVLDVAALFDVGEHLLQRWAVHRGAGDATFDELLGDEGAQLSGLAFGGVPLCGDREALFTPTTSGLVTRGDAQIDDGLREDERRTRGQSRGGRLRRRNGTHSLPIDARLAVEVQSEIALFRDVLRCATYLIRGGFSGVPVLFFWSHS